MVLSPHSLSAQTTTFIGGAAGDDTIDVPASTWIRSDNVDASQTDNAAFIGGISDTHDFIGVLSFDLSKLAGVTSISSVTIRLPQEGEIFDNRLGSLTTMTTTLTPLNVTPTNEATWNTYDGFTPWTTPGGTDDVTGTTFTSNSFDLDTLIEDDATSAAIVIPTSPELEALILANVGGRVDFLWRVPVAEEGNFEAGRNFVVFDGAATGSNGAIDSSPQLVVVSNLASEDPIITVVAEPQDITLELGSAPETTTLTIRNDGATETLTGTASVVGEGFSITSPTSVNIAPGNTQDFIVQFDPGTATPGIPSNATVSLNTNSQSNGLLDFAIVGLVSDGINLGSGGLDMATRGGNLAGSGISAFGWVRDDDPGRIAGGTTSFMGTSDGSSKLRGFIGFDLSQFSPGDSVGSATMSLWSQGAGIFNANGGIEDLGETTLELRSLPAVTGFGDEFGNDANVDGLPANWDTLEDLFGNEVIATADANIDTIAFGDEVQFDVTAAVQAAIAAGEAQISFGIVASGAEEGGARNFFAFGGMADNGGSAGSDIGPNLNIVTGPSGPIQITDIQYVPAGNEVDVLITWDSAHGFTYALDQTNDLSNQDWEEVTNSILSQGDQTTFRNTLFGEVPSKLFFRIRQVVN
jgi:hypothetical protein